MLKNITSLPTPSATASSDNGHRHGSDVAAIVGGIVGSIVGLLVLVVGALWIVCGCKRRKPASLLDMTGTRTEPTPFEGRQEIHVSRQSLRYLASYTTEKQRRKMEQENAALPLTTEPSVASSGVTSAPPGPSTTSSASHQARQDELVVLRTDIEDLRRIVLNSHIELPEGSEAPPEYS